MTDDEPETSYGRIHVLIQGGKKLDDNEEPS
jgi:hypothetical protein